MFVLILAETESLVSLSQYCLPLNDSFLRLCVANRALLMSGILEGIPGGSILDGLTTGHGQRRAGGFGSPSWSPAPSPTLTWTLPPWLKSRRRSSERLL